MRITHRELFMGTIYIVIWICVFSDLIPLYFPRLLPLAGGPWLRFYYAAFIIIIKLKRKEIKMYLH